MNKYEQEYSGSKPYCNNGLREKTMFNRYETQSVSAGYRAREHSRGTRWNEPDGQ